MTIIIDNTTEEDLAKPMSEPYEVALEKHREEVTKRLEDFAEKQKSQNPNVVSAARTFVDDLVAYTKGHRPDFPREALLGLLGAYLRPRAVIIAAGLIATLLAGFQSWLIYRQNLILSVQTALMDQQTKLLDSQARIGRAEAVSRLLPALGGKDTLSSSDTILIAAYGDAANDILTPLVLQGYPEYDADSRNSQYLWLNAADVLTRKLWQGQIKNEQMSHVFFKVLDATRAIQQHMRPDEFLSYELLLDDLQVREIKSTVTDAVEDYRRLLRILARFGDVFSAAALTQLPPYDRDRAARSFAEIYAFMEYTRFDNDTGPVYQIDKELDQKLSLACKSLNGEVLLTAKPTIGTLLAAGNRTPLPTSLKGPRAVTALIHHACAKDQFERLPDAPPFGEMKEFVREAESSMLTAE